MEEEVGKAESFLAKHDLRVSIKYVGDDRPEYSDEETKYPHYVVTIRRVNGPRLSFDFWDGSRKAKKAEGQVPTVYDVLSDLGDSSRSGESPDEIYSQFGAMKPSQATGMARFVRRLRKFFTQEELSELRELRAAQTSEGIYA